MAPCVAAVQLAAVALPTRCRAADGSLTRRRAPHGVAMAAVDCAWPAPAVLGAGGPVVGVPRATVVGIYHQPDHRPAESGGLQRSASAGPRAQLMTGRVAGDGLACAAPLRSCPARCVPSPRTSSGSSAHRDSGAGVWDR